MPRYVGWPVLAIGLSFALPPGLPRTLSHALIDAAAAAVAVVAVRRHGPERGLPWWVLCLGMSANGVAGLAASARLAGIAPPTMAAVSAQGDLATALLLAAAAVLFLVARTAGSSRDGLVDGGIVLFSALLLVLASPLARRLEADAPLVIGTTAALIGAVVFSALVALDPGRRSPSLAYLLTATGLAFAATLVSGWRDTPPPLVDAAYLQAQVLAALAALDPSMQRLAAPSARADGGLDPLRLVVLGLALLANPAVVLVHVVSDEDSRVPLALGVGALTLIVLARLARLLFQRLPAGPWGGEERFRALVQHAVDVIAVLDARGSVGYISPSAAHVLGRPPRSCHGRHLRQLVARDDAPTIDAALAAVRREAAGVTRVEVRLEGGGTVRWGDVLLADRLADPSVQGIVVNLRDVTERKRAELELSRLALHDPLTGLPNRARLLERVTAVLAREGLEQEWAAVFFCDLDGFKAVNDRYGHDLGDQLLRAVAERFREALRDGDEATRLGGDEFVVLCCGIESQAQALAIGARLRSRVSEPFALRGVEVHVGCSVGIALADRPGLEPQGILAAADLAMYRAKRLPGGVALHRWSDLPRTPRPAAEPAGSGQRLP